MRRGVVLLSLALGGTIWGVGIASDGTEVVAEVGGHKITRAELEQKESAIILKPQSQYYQAERQAVDQLIDDYLLEQKAQQEHLTVDELIKRDIESKIKDPTDDQLQVYYEGVGTDEPFPAVRDKILLYIHRARLKKAKIEYIRNLHDQIAVTVSLDAPTAVVSVDGSPMRGPKDARVHIIEFADYECPYCQQVHPLLTKLGQEFDGKVALVYKDMPLPMHAQSAKAAEAARCAGDQGKFWELHDLLFENSKHLEMAQLKEYARTLKLDGDRFDKCLDSGAQTAAVQKDFAEAQHLGLTGTPSFFINGHFFSGAVKYASLREMVEQELASPVVAASPTPGSR